MITEGALIKYYDHFYYENVILMAPSIKEGDVAEGLKVADLMTFFEGDNSNLMIFADKEARRHVRKIALNFGVDFEGYVSILQ